MNNFYAGIPGSSESELFQALVEKNGVTIERIISSGQRTPDGEWLAQDRDEWVILLSGGAELLFEEWVQSRRMNPGDYIYIPSGARHRVNRTDPEALTLWLAVHFPPPAGNS